jgi:hypothetical protein
METTKTPAGCRATAHTAKLAASVDTDGASVQGYYYAPDGGHHRGAPIPNTQTGPVGQFAATVPGPVSVGFSIWCCWTVQGPVPHTGDGGDPNYHPIVR